MLGPIINYRTGFTMIASLALKARTQTLISYGVYGQNGHGLARQVLAGIGQSFNPLRQKPYVTIALNLPHQIVPNS